MKKLLYITLSILIFACSGNNSQEKKNNKFDKVRKELIANESTRWMGMAEPKVSDFEIVNDSTFNISSEFKHPFLEKDVIFIYQYYYNSNLDSIIKDDELIKTLTLVEGDYVEFDMFK